MQLLKFFNQAFLHTHIKHIVDAFPREALLHIHTYQAYGWCPPKGSFSSYTYISSILLMPSQGTTCSRISLNKNMSRLTTKPTKWCARPAKTTISRPVRSESSLSGWRKLGPELPIDLSAQSFCWFCHEVAQICVSTNLITYLGWPCNFYHHFEKMSIHLPTLPS